MTSIYDKQRNKAKDVYLKKNMRYLEKFLFIIIKSHFLSVRCDMYATKPNTVGLVNTAFIHPKHINPIASALQYKDNK